MAGLINYVRKVFKNYPDTSTPTTAENLNVMDKGIYDLDQALGTALGTADISTVGDGTIKGAISILDNDLTANSQKFAASYQNGKYGFTINGTFYEIGGGSMPALDYSNPLKTFDSSTSYTATKECYLIGQLTVNNNKLSINSKIIMRADAASGEFVKPFINGIRLSRGDTVTILSTETYLHVFGLI